MSNLPVETLEARYPLLVEEYALRDGFRRRRANIAAASGWCGSTGCSPTRRSCSCAPTAPSTRPRACSAAGPARPRATSSTDGDGWEALPGKVTLEISRRHRRSATSRPGRAAGATRRRATRAAIGRRHRATARSARNGRRRTMERGHERDEGGRRHRRGERHRRGHGAALRRRRAGASRSPTSNAARGDRPSRPSSARRFTGLDVADEQAIEALAATSLGAPRRRWRALVELGRHPAERRARAPTMEWRNSTGSTRSTSAARY